jgi:hypothetical protein
MCNGRVRREKIRGGRDGVDILAWRDIKSWYRDGRRWQGSASSDGDRDCTWHMPGRDDRTGSSDSLSTMSAVELIGTASRIEHERIRP